MMNKAKKQTRVTQILKAPIKILGKARDFYVKGMNELAASSASLSKKSYSVVKASRASEDEDFRQLLRAASTRVMEQSNGMAWRSYSVSVGKIGRIEEDTPCAFEANLLVYPRSRSHAVKRN